MQNEIQLAIVLPSAGIGTRLPGAIKKQYRKIANKEVFLLTLENVIRVKYLKEIIIVIQPDDEEFIRAKLNQYFPSQTNLIKFAEGGTSRQISVFNGLKKVSNFINVVAIHDMVRPFATTELFDNAVRETQNADGVLPVLPVKETIKEVENSWVEKTPDRIKLFTAQTPQVFNKQVILKSNENFESHLLDVTDDSQIAELNGFKVKTIMGEDFNFKITTVSDMLYAEYLIKNGFIKVT